MTTELDNLEGLVAQADAGAIALDPQAQQEEAAQAGPDYGTEARGAVDLFAAMVCGYAPKAESVWNEGAKARTAAALAPVMEKYGFTLGNLPPELTLAIVAGPLLWQSSKIVAAQMAQEKSQAKPQAQAQAQPQEANPAPEPGRAPAPEVHPQVRLYQQGGGV